MIDPYPPFVPPGYSLVRQLGSGQTAHVFLAEHAQHRTVALKLPRAELGDRPVLRRMFESEVQITLGLHHRNLVAAYEGSPTGSEAYLALEYCSRGTLGELLVSQRPPLQQARELIADIARGLEYCHGRQVLHRDVKPANVFLDAGATAKLGDFGTGMHIGDDNDERAGTAFYMAPEIFEGDSASVRSDVYSLGILAYEVIAGVRPFSGESYEDLMMAHLSGFPKALAHHRPEVSRAEGKVIATAMARNAGQRYPTVREFREAFVAAAGLSEPAAEEKPRTGRASRKPKPHNEPDDEAKGSETRNQGGLFGWFKRKREE